VVFAFIANACLQGRIRAFLLSRWSKSKWFLGFGGGERKHHHHTVVVERQIIVG
jgi:hypothetical protein